MSGFTVAGVQKEGSASIFAPTIPEEPPNSAFGSLRWSSACQPSKPLPGQTHMTEPRPRPLPRLKALDDAVTPSMQGWQMFLPDSETGTLRKTLRVQGLEFLF